MVSVWKQIHSNQPFDRGDDSHGEVMVLRLHDDVDRKKRNSFII